MTNWVIKSNIKPFYAKTWQVNHIWVSLLPPEKQLKWGEEKKKKLLRTLKDKEKKETRHKQKGEKAGEWLENNLMGKEITIKYV